MASTAPSTPKSKPRFLTCPDTELGHSQTTSSQYLSGDLSEGRRVVLNNLKRYLRVPLRAIRQWDISHPPGRSQNSRYLSNIMEW